MGKVFCIGDFTVDMIVPFGEMKDTVKGFSKDSSRKSPRIYTQAGGGIANTSLALARLGIVPTIVSKIGSDSCAREAIEFIKNAGVDTSQLIIDPGSAKIIGVVIDSDGERYVSTWMRPDSCNGEFSAGDTSGIDVSGCTWVHTGGINITGCGEHEREIVSFVRRCRESGAAVSFDLNLRYETFGYDEGRKKIFDELIDLSDIVLGSGIDEFGPATGKSDIIEAGMSIADKGKTVVVRDKAKPVVLISGGRKTTRDVFHVHQLHTVGAGDSFDAGFIAAEVYGKSHETAVAWGCACAARTISRMEPMTVPDLSELQALQD
ncbi:MAG: carbohydrate kinase family protein [Oscillospiraceae bacterium]|jgi:sugar/nucleoside kinase (ribokinase family)